VQLSVLPDRVDILLADDGVGFPFHGQYDLAKLTARNLGPRSMKERIASLKGELVLTTSLSGSELKITLPNPRHAWPMPTRSLAAD
jgi:signal transduction histidine kinase